VSIVKAVAGHAFNLVLTADGKVWGWGRNEQGQVRETLPH
jgi:alpha-tubulin suppressor-like RCC1 family protein